MKKANPYDQIFHSDMTKGDIVLKNSFLVYEGQELVGFAVQSQNKQDHLTFVRSGHYGGKPDALMQQIIREHWCVFEALRANPALRQQVEQAARDFQRRKQQAASKLSLARAYGVQSADHSEGWVYCPMCLKQAQERLSALQSNNRDLQHPEDRRPNEARLLTTFDSNMPEETVCSCCGAKWLQHKGLWESEIFGWNPDQQRIQQHALSLAKGNEPQNPLHRITRANNKNPRRLNAPPQRLPYRKK